jgi:hypothetical protein
MEGGHSGADPRLGRAGESSTLEGHVPSIVAGARQASMPDKLLTVHNSSVYLRLSPAYTVSLIIAGTTDRSLISDMFVDDVTFTVNY